MPDHIPNKSFRNLVLEILLVGLGAGCCGSFLILMFLLIYDPSGMIFLGSLVPPERFTLLIRLIIIIYHSWLIAVAHIGVCAFASGVLIYAYYITPFYLWELKLGRKKYHTSNDLRTLANIQLMFRATQILHTNCLYVIGILILLLNGYTMYTVMFCNAVLMRYWSALMPVSRFQLCAMSVTLLYFWTFVLELGRFFFAKGSKTIGSWKGNKWGSSGSNKEMKKFLRSCRPIVISYESKFVIRRSTLLIFLRGVVRGMFRMLMLLRKPK